MEGLNHEYSMLLSRPWLWQAKVHHDWSTNLLSLFVLGRIIAVLTHPVFSIQPCHNPLTLQMYDSMVGLMDEEEDQVLKTHPELKPITKPDMRNILNLAECYEVEGLIKGGETTKHVKLVTTSEDHLEVYPVHFHMTKEGSVDVYEEFAKEKVKGHTILGWNLTPEETGYPH